MPAHPGHDLPSYRKGGNRLNARQHNNMAAMAGALQRLQLGDGLGGEITPSGLRLYLTRKQKPIVPEAGGATIRLATVKIVHESYVSVYFLSDTFSGQEVPEYISVARPKELRVPSTLNPLSAHDGITFERVAAFNGDERRAIKGSRVELQVLTPKYRNLDRIFVLYTGDNDVNIPGSKKAQWIDLNVGGRMFQVSEVISP